ncbi:hypothetical protein [Tsukamurella tyrosinosolvens]|uniref:hypothetical protein n=1 Tax=Tsukamurella tyrosinosolvens TaxID=57704 RepID=UPI0013753568|nr:hypothetical protein [Tsukamurella tyrosinosolvens]
MPDYDALGAHADLGGIEAHPDLTEDLRPDAPRGHEKGDPGCHPNRLENTHQHL